jgi:U3 small nucleolar RNA-associated protein 7
MDVIECKVVAVTRVPSGADFCNSVAAFSQSCTSQDRVLGSTFLHNETWFALAQSKYVHIYDKQGIELHILRNHQKPSHVEYLPYHWLLVSSGSQGFLRWTDVSIGELVAERNAHSGPVTAMRQNAWNAIMLAGHAQGSVSMWAPNMDKPAVKMLAHRGPLHSMAVDKGGHTLVTAGLDGFVNVWDLRTYKQLHYYRARDSTATVDISARGMLCMGEGHTVSVWPADALSLQASKPYMRCNLPTRKVCCFFLSL